MTAIEVYDKKHENIRKKMKMIVLPTDGSATRVCWSVGNELQVSGPTVMNYVSGEIKDGYLAECIFNEFKRLKMVTNK